MALLWGLPALNQKELFSALHVPTWDGYKGGEQQQRPPKEQNRAGDNGNDIDKVRNITKGGGGFQTACRGSSEGKKAMTA